MAGLWEYSEPPVWKHSPQMVELLSDSNPVEACQDDRRLTEPRELRGRVRERV